MIWDANRQHDRARTRLESLAIATLQRGRTERRTEISQRRAAAVDAAELGADVAQEAAYAVLQSHFAAADQAIAQLRLDLMGQLVTDDIGPERYGAGVRDIAALYRRLTEPWMRDYRDATQRIEATRARLVADAESAALIEAADIEKTYIDGCTAATADAHQRGDHEHCPSQHCEVARDREKS